MPEVLIRQRIYFETLIQVLAVSSTRMNFENYEGRTGGLDIIGMNLNSKKRARFLAKSKVSRYSSGLSTLRKLGVAWSKELQKLSVIWCMPLG